MTWSRGVMLAVAVQLAACGGPGREQTPSRGASSDRVGAAAESARRDDGSREALAHAAEADSASEAPATRPCFVRREESENGTTTTVRPRYDAEGRLVGATVRREGRDTPGEYELAYVGEDCAPELTHGGLSINVDYEDDRHPFRRRVQNPLGQFPFEPYSMHRTFTCDEHGFVERIDDALTDGTTQPVQAWQFSVDEEGRWTERTSQHVRILRVRDEEGRPMADVWTYRGRSGPGREMRVRFWYEGERLVRRQAGEVTVHFDYEDGRLIRVRAEGPDEGGEVTTATTQLTYDEAGRLSRFERTMEGASAPEAWTELSYDENGRLVRVERLAEYASNSEGPDWREVYTARYECE